jgi:hypothetical protein
MTKTKRNSRIILRIPDPIHARMSQDLRRPHPHAWERVGFLFTRSKWIDRQTLLIIAISYEPVADDHYLVDNSVGAKIGAAAMRRAMENMYEWQAGCFHIHLHNHRGTPSPSPTDEKGLPGVVESLSHIAGNQATGLIILSDDGFFTRVHIPGRKKLVAATQVTVVGFPLRLHMEKKTNPLLNHAFDRQSFLGPDAQHLLENVRIGVIGYGGGGSHIGQQLAHIGVQHPVIFDDDHMEETNLNRLVGARFSDVTRQLRKTAIAKRLIRSVLPGAKIEVVNNRWQDNPERLQQCDLVVGCVDSYTERQQLEAECRRYLVPLIDIGMDVHQPEGTEPVMSGQVMLSMPGMPCLWCYGFLTEEKLGREAARYGKVGGRPQVVWPNGVLASTAVGIVLELITGWTGRRNEKVYLEYDGNTGVLKEHIRKRFAPETCSHFHLHEAGPALFRKL